MFTLDVWNQIVFTVDFVANKIYCNSKWQCSHCGGGVAYTQAAFNDIRILDRVSARNGKFVIDEFRVYDRIISDIEIATNYNGGLTNNTSITSGILA